MKNRRHYRQGTSHCSCLEHCFLLLLLTRGILKVGIGPLQGGRHPLKISWIGGCLFAPSKPPNHRARIPFLLIGHDAAQYVQSRSFHPGLNREWI